MSGASEYLPKIAAEIIDRYGCRPVEVGEMSTFYVGSAQSPVAFDSSLLPSSFVGVEEWSDSCGRRFYVSVEDSIVLAVQDNDVRVEVFKTFLDFYAAVKVLEESFGTAKVLSVH